MKETIRMNNWDTSSKSSGVVTGVVASEIGTLIMERDRIRAVRDNLQRFYDYLLENRELPAFEKAIHESVIDFYTTEYYKLKTKVSYRAQDIAVEQGLGFFTKNGEFVEGTPLKLGKSMKVMDLNGDEASA